MRHTHPGGGFISSLSLQTSKRLHLMLGERLSAWFGTDHGGVVKDVLSGKERILPLVDIRRYPCRTLSACHFAALNFVRVAFKHMQRTRGASSPSMVRWLSVIMERHVLEEMLSPCEQLTSEQAIQLEEMYRIPLFEGPLVHVATKHGPPSMILLKQSLRQMQLHASPVSAIVVSRNSGTTVCLKFRENFKDVFLVLDLALASEHGATLALVISTSLEQTAARMSGILPVDNHLVTRDRRWQAQLFTSCTICMFTPAEGVVMLSDAESLAINESVALLRVMGEIDDRGRDRERERDGKRDRNRRQSDQPSGSSQRELRKRTPFDVDGAEPTTSRGYAGGVGVGSLGEGSSVRMEKPRPKTTFIPYEQTKRYCRIFFSDDESSAPTSTSTIPTSLSYEGSDEEACFECVICFEDIPEEKGIHLLPCAHGFCRGCLVGHVCSKIEERKFPVFCPLCMAEQGNASPSELWFNDSGYPSHSMRSGLSSNWHICVCGYIVAGDRRVDLTIVRTWNSCDPRCNRSAFVDKEDYEQSEELRCPFPGCRHTWCKNCQQSLSGGKLKHSCDGAEELDYLVKQMGWKYCPSKRVSFNAHLGVGNESVILGHRMQNSGSKEWGMQSYDVRDTRMQHAFLLQVREADHESVYPAPCEVCCERTFQTMYALSHAEMR
ncbi:hypothetical protein J3R82DRAFT_4986 [Butyriboletus roseoflavus]|nr:hypothetical protein J3R82DRAFT_4986 [Butyriboletus roseoflavus]